MSGRAKRGATEKIYEEVESDVDLEEAEKSLSRGKIIRRDGFGAGGELRYSSGHAADLWRKSGCGKSEIKRVRCFDSILMSRHCSSSAQEEGPKASCKLRRAEESGRRALLVARNAS